MKIPKLFTSQGFGFWLKSMTTKEFCKLSGAPEPTVIEGANGFFRIDAVRLRLRDDWDKKLTGSLKKEMFVNELEKPKYPDYQEDMGIYKHALESWQEAEKKVIFKGKVYIHAPKSDDLARISIHNNFKVFDLNIIFGETTFHDLAEPIEGERELEHVEL